jgi:hypothetical protein
MSQLRQCRIGSVVERRGVSVSAEPAEVLHDVFRDAKARAEPDQSQRGAVLRLTPGA